MLYPIILAVLKLRESLVFRWKSGGKGKVTKGAGSWPAIGMMPEKPG